MVCKIADLTAMPFADLYHVQTWELYPLVELTSRPFVFNNFILIEKFSGKYCELRLSEDSCFNFLFFTPFINGHCGRDRMVVGFTTTCAISAYHH
jgi:hypothetical protein